MIELTADILASLSCAAFRFNEIHIRRLFRGEKSKSMESITVRFSNL